MEKKVENLQPSIARELSNLPSSFPEFISSKPYYVPPPQVNNLLSNGMQLCSQGQFSYGISRFEQAIKQTPSNHPNNPFLAELHRNNAVAYQNIGNYPKAIENLNSRMNILYERKDSFGMEQTSKELAQLHIRNGTIEQYEKTNSETLSRSLKNGDQQLELRARLALGGVSRMKGNHEKAMSHYSVAYELQQGRIDHEAVRVEQHEVGFSNQKIGTDNIQQCVAVILHDPVTKKTALAHVDIHTDAKSLSDVIKNFPNGANLNAYLVGGRDRSPQSKSISDTNIA
jgi:tetratricopeptide (TPR) repeat protein